MQSSIHRLRYWCLFSMSVFALSIASGPARASAEATVSVSRAELHRCVSQFVPKRGRQYIDHIWSTSEHYDVPFSLALAVIRTESAWHSTAVSGKGAMGLMQLMPSTAKFLGVRRAYDPEENIRGGIKLLRMLAKRFKGDMVLIVAGYNAGAGAVQKSGGIPRYKETRKYVHSVMRRYFQYRSTLLRCLEGSVKER